MKSRPLTVFWGNERVTHQAIIAMQREETWERMRQSEEVLLVQDTTSLDFSTHRETVGLGTLENKRMRGLFVHTTLAVSSEGVPLGVFEQQVWARDPATTGKAKKRKDRPFETKESYRWVLGVPEALHKQPTGPRCITVCDAEGHIYAFLTSAQSRGADFVVRGAAGRSFDAQGQDIFQGVADWPCQDRFSLAVEGQREEAGRLAELEVRFGAFTVRRPADLDGYPEQFTLHVVDVYEPHPPAGVTPIHWLLLTNLPVPTLSDAQRIIRYYTYRWRVERFHFVLKSGCKIEESQLRAADRLERLLAVYSLVAWKLLYLTYQTRVTPDIPCTVILHPAEWQALACFIQRVPRPPLVPPTLRQAAHWIGRLGGFLGRPSDGEPGVKVLWRGWTRLQDIVATWSLFRPPPLVGND